MESEDVRDNTFWLPRSPMSMEHPSTSSGAPPALDTKSTTNNAPASCAISPISARHGVRVPLGVSQCTAVMTFGRKDLTCSQTFCGSGTSLYGNAHTSALTPKLRAMSAKPSPNSPDETASILSPGLSVHLRAAHRMDIASPEVMTISFWVWSNLCVRVWFSL